VALAGGTRSYREVAREFGVTRVEVCQYVALVRRLPPELVTKVESETRPMVLRTYSLRKLLALARTEPAEDPAGDMIGQ
jgi:DNA-binding transcriptional regulator YdaS (Cro superfamily)